MEDMSIYIHKLLKKYHPNKSFTIISFKFIRTLLEHTLYKISRLYQKDSDLKNVIKSMFGDISDNIINECNKAIVKFNLLISEDIDIWKPLNFLKKVENSSLVYKLMNGVTRSYYAELTLLTLVIENSLKKLGYTIYNDYFVIFITAILECLIVKIFMILYVENDIITSDNIITAIGNNEELHKIINDIFPYKNWNNYENLTKIPIKNNGILEYAELKVGLLYERMKLNKCTYDFNFLESFILKTEKLKLNN